MVASSAEMKATMMGENTDLQMVELTAAMSENQLVVQKELVLVHLLVGQRGGDSAVNLGESSVTC
jgi:hypothetical protein